MVAKSLGMRLVSIWLISFGILVYLPVVVPLDGLAMALLSIAAGLVLLYEVRIEGVELRRNLGTILLGAWLVISGPIQIFVVETIDLAAMALLLAAFTGGVLLNELRKGPVAGNLGKISLSIWLIEPLLTPAFGISAGLNLAILGLLGFVTGVLILLGR